MDTKNILLTNDDGINSPGILALYDQLSNKYNVIIVAPDNQKSAISHAITIFSPIYIKEVEKNMYAISGTPADCIKVALSGLIDVKIDAIISGINDGPNMGMDVYYSGTVAAAREGCYKGIRSIAVSVDEFTGIKNYKVIADYFIGILDNLLLAKIEKNVFYNVNFPNINRKKDIKGTKITQLGKRVFNEYLIKRSSPIGSKYVWLGSNPTFISNSESDFDAVANGFVSITPIKLDATSYDTINSIKDIFTNT